VSSATGPFKRDYLDVQTVFPDEPGVSEPNADFLHTQISVTADTRDYPGRPTRGSHYRASTAAYSDMRVGAYSFRRYELEGLKLVPLLDGAVILALRGWSVFSDTRAGGKVPFYLLPSLGGANTIRGFANYRFHDRHLLLANVESRWPLFQHVDAAVFVDAGTVAARVKDLGFDKTAYGFGLRVHSHMSTTARVDIAHGAEGWQVVFRLDDVFRLSRRSQWTAAVPFVP
jgi:outer membrane protein assembly factor BamA